MEAGFVAGGGIGIAFYPGESSIGLHASFRMIRKFLSGKRIFKWIGASGHHCPACRIVLFSY
jgi:hypothetical protein